MNELRIGKPRAGKVSTHADLVEEDDDAKFASQSVPVVQEELQVGKRAINVGGLRVIKRMSETPVSEIVKLREERATIERRPGDRKGREANLENFEGGRIEVREMSEQGWLARQHASSKK